MSGATTATVASTTRPRRAPASPDVVVCVCTFRRPALLEALLPALARQRPPAAGDYAIVVVDNDSACSALPVVERFRSRHGVPVRYCHEPRQNIALARNRALELAGDGLVAFIDDDEVPADCWLDRLMATLLEHDASAVLGPVLPRFDGQPPRWVARSRLCERRRFPTGARLSWGDTRTGNVLLSRRLVADEQGRFDAEFGRLGGEDVDFFRRLADRHRLVWCDEAVVYEHLPHQRTTAAWFLRRAYLQGHISFHYYGHSADSGDSDGDDRRADPAGRRRPRREVPLALRMRVLCRSLAAWCAYSTILPATMIGGFPVFIRYLVKWTHHLSRCLTALGVVNPRKRAP